jgi:autotransporter-associated beta strand protein
MSSPIAPAGYRPRLVRFAALLGLLAAAGPASAQTYNWTAPTGSSSNFSGLGWDTTPPSGGSATTALVLNYPGGLPASATYILTNDLGNPFDLNALAFNTYSSSTSGGFTLASATLNTLQFNGANAVVNQNGLGLVTMSSTVSLNTGATARIGSTNNIFGLGNVTLSGIVSGGGGLVVGNGASGNAPTQNTRVVSLTAANTFTGGTTLDGGNLSLGNNAALGTGSTLTVTANGGTLQASTALSALTVSGLVLNGQLQMLGASAITLGDTAVLSGAGNLVIRNTSTTALTVQSNSPAYSGTVTLDRGVLPQISGAAGTLTLSGSSGALTGVGTFNVFAGGSLVLSSNVASSIPNANRIANTAVVNLRTGNLTLTGAVDGTALTEAFGGLTGAGYNTVTVGVGTTAGATVLNAATVARVERGTFLFRGTTLGTAGNSGFVALSTAPTGDLIGGGGAAGTQTISILPYAVGGTSTTDTGTTLVTLDAAANGGVAGATGVRPLATAEFATNLSGGATTNARLTAATANAGTTTVNALVLATGGQVTGTGTLAVTSGVILNASSTSPQISNTVAFGAAEGFLYTPTAMTVSGNLTGTNGLTKSGTGALTLSGNNTGLTGQLTINAGQVSFAADTGLPGTGAIVANGAGSSSASLQYTGATAVTIARDITVGSGWLTLNSSNSAATLTLSGVISGNGGLFVGSTSAASTIILTGTNTYTGPTRVNEGVLVISSDANLGVGGGLDLFTIGSTMPGGGEGIRITGNWTTGRHVNFSNTNFVDTQGNTAVWNGVVTGTGTLIKAGTGLLQMNAASPYTGIVTLNAGGGELRLAQNGALLSATYNVNAGTTLGIDNTTLPTGSGAGTVTTERVNNAAIINLASATLRFTGNGTQGTIERVGNVIVTGSGSVIEALSSGGQTNSLFINNLSTAGGNVLVRGTNLGGTTGSLGRIFLTQMNGAAVSNGLFLAGVTAEDINNAGVIESAVYDTTIGVRLVNPATDFTNGPAIQNGAPTNLPTTANFRANPAVANPVPVLDAANTIGSLRFAPNGVVNYAGAVASDLTVSSGLILTEAGGAASITNTGIGQLTITAGASPLAVIANSNLTVNAVLGGTGGISKSGAGTLTLNTAPTNTGAIAVNGGTLALGTGVSVTAAGLNGVAGTTVSLGANNLTLNGGAASSYSGVITGTGAINYTPSAAVGLTLNGNNTFSGGVTGGTTALFVLGHANGFGTGPVAFTNNSGTVTYNTGTATVANNFTLPAPTAAATFAFTNGGNVNQTVTLTGVIGGGSSFATFRVSGPADDSSGFVLANPNNTFTGIVSIFEGFLAVASNGALGNAANSVNLNTTTTTTGGLRFDANFTGGNVLARNLNFLDTNVLNTNGNTVEVSGVVSNTGALLKTGAGTLILSNATNTHTGAMTVNAGTLLVNGAVAGAATPPAVTVNTGGTFGGNGTVGATGTTRNITVAAGGTLAPGDSAIGTLSVNGNTTLTGAAPGTGAVFAVRAARSGANAIGSNDLLAYNGNLNFAGLAAGTPTAGDNKFRITVISDGANPLVTGENYTMTIASYILGGTGQIQRNGTQVNTFAYTFDANDYQLSSPSFTAFNSVSLVANADGTLVLAFTPVPEPASVLAVCGLATAAGWLVRRRRQRV